MTQEEMNILVPEKLRQIERTYDVTVLYAAESGSRAWGFASPDSDFDVRFIYKRKQSDYLRLEQIRDVIDFPVDEVWDVSGWDLDKTLKLLHSSNPSLYDWFGSPICYYDNGFKAQFEPLMKSYFSLNTMMHHYHSIAKHDIERLKKADPVKPKKYFYALRAILNCIWIMNHNEAPPVPFSELYKTVLPTELRGQVDEIMEIKIHKSEKAGIAHIAEIDAFLDSEYAALGEMIGKLPKEQRRSWDELNRFFISQTA